MGFFDKLFGKGNANKDLNLSKTAEMLDEDVYWKIVFAGLKKSPDQDKQEPDQDKQEQTILSQLQKLSPDEMIGFKLRTDKLLYDIYNSEMWCAGYIINGGCSDDGFEYFRCWVISRGKEVYYKAKSTPDTLINQLSDEIEDYEFESFLYIANDAFKAKTGKDIHDFIHDGNFKFKEGQITLDFTWEEDKPETLKAICPNLFKAKWN